MELIDSYPQVAPGKTDAPDQRIVALSLISVLMQTLSA
ncbi:hypothetical protein CP97_14811 [Aurantiacibacter atlanticus]|uniref:Uncharacterized protein n=1 Tax=Aurantiacibacter atlanticus TaxID=1648404 RepID=A0A168M2W7_9SPHN|nr:hypothetical protein CP97_14811 [Aurantiacibacter atlanticus]